MSAPAPKGYQREAVNNALEIFRYAEGQLRQSVDDASNAAATAPAPATAMLKRALIGKEST